MWRFMLAACTCQIAAAQPCEPDLLGTLSLPNDHAARHVLVRDGLAYVANRLEGLLIADVTDPSAPRTLSVVKLPDLVQDVDVVESPIGWLALVTIRTQGLGVVDIEDPESPRVVSTVNGLVGSAESVLVNWPYAYVTTVGVGLVAGGLHVIDMSDPASPVVLSFEETPGHSQGLALAGSTLVVADASWASARTTYRRRAARSGSAPSTPTASRTTCRSSTTSPTLRTARADSRPSTSRSLGTRS